MKEVGRRESFPLAKISLKHFLRTRNKKEGKSIISEGLSLIPTGHPT